MCSHNVYICIRFRILPLVPGCDYLFALFLALLFSLQCARVDIIKGCCWCPVNLWISHHIVLKSICVGDMNVFGLKIKWCSEWALWFPYPTSLIILFLLFIFVFIICLLHVTPHRCNVPGCMCGLLNLVTHCDRGEWYVKLTLLMFYCLCLCIVLMVTIEELWEVVKPSIKSVYNLCSVKRL